MSLYGKDDSNANKTKAEYWRRWNRLTSKDNSVY